MSATNARGRVGAVAMLASDASTSGELGNAESGAEVRTAARPVAPPRTKSERDAMIVDNVNLVRMIAARISRRLPSHVDSEELVNVGILGLIDAVDRFDTDRGTPFKAYAEIRIRGAIVDSLRQSDWVPLVIRRKLARIETTRTTLRQQLGAEPTRADMAKALGLSPDGYDDLVGNSVVHHLVSLDAPSDVDSGVSLADRLADSSEHALDRWIGDEARKAMAGAIHMLPQMEREVLHLYYEKGLKYREIGSALGVCESRVCQLRTQAISRVRRQVAAATP